MNDISFLPLFKWLEQTSIGVYMQQSTYAFAIVEMVHLISLTLLGGAILIVDLRLLGLGIKSRSAARLAKDLKVLIVGSLSMAVVSGVLLLSEESLKCYYSPAFRAKMLCLLLAVLFYFLVQARLLRLEGTDRSFVLKSAGAISLGLWLAVGLAGRAIGFI